MAVGRPSSYKERYCEAVIDHLRQGKSLAAFAALIGTHREVVWKWRQKYVDFDNACLTGLEHSQVWWENLAAAVATGKVMDIEQDAASPNFGKPKLPHTNPGMIMFLMKQRFSDYRNIAKREDDDEKALSLTVNFNNEELDAEIQKRTERVIRRRNAPTAKD